MSLVQILINFSNQKNIPQEMLNIFDSVINNCQMGYVSLTNDDLSKLEKSAKAYDIDVSGYVTKVKKILYITAVNRLNSQARLQAKLGDVNKMESFLTEAKEYNTFNPEKTSKQFLSEIDTIKIKGYIAGEQKYSNEANNFANESNFEQTKKSVLSAYECSLFLVESGAIGRKKLSKYEQKYQTIISSAQRNQDSLANENDERITNLDALLLKQPIKVSNKN